MQDTIIESAINEHDKTKLMIATKAKAIVNALDPYLATSSKPEICVRAEGSKLEMLATDPAHVMMMHSTTDRDRLAESSEVTWVHWVDDLRILLSLDKVLPALKWFGNQFVAVSLYDDRVVIANQSGRRTIRTTFDEGNAMKIPALTLPVSAHLSLADHVPRILGISDLDDFVTFSTEGGVLTVQVGTDTVAESAEVKVDLPSSTGDARVMLPTDYVVSTFKHIKSISTGFVDMGFDTDYPSKFSWIVGHVAFEAMIAPRIAEEGE